MTRFQFRLIWGFKSGRWPTQGNLLRQTSASRHPPRLNSPGPGQYLQLCIKEVGQGSNTRDRWLSRLHRWDARGMRCSWRMRWGRQPVCSCSHSMHHSAKLVRVGTPCLILQGFNQVKERNPTMVCVTYECHLVLWVFDKWIFIMSKRAWQLRHELPQ